MDPASMYREKKKKAVDPNAPPRPNLLSHEKTIKETKQTIEHQSNLIDRLEHRVYDLEAKLNRQTAYLTELHNAVTRLISKK